MAAEFAGLNVLVAGAGVTGRSTVAALVELGAHVTVTDGRPEALADFGDLAAPGLTEPPPGTDLVVTSPGWKPTSPLLVAALSAGIEVIGEVELAWRLSSGQTWLAVTGTDGKTTTVGMLESILLAAGLKAVACGNVGLPVIDAVRAGYEVLAVELSSYQLYWQDSLRPDAAVILNLAEDHLEWHGTMDEYAAAKAKIYTGARTRVFNADDEWSVRLSGGGTGFTVHEPGQNRFGVVDNWLVDQSRTKATPPPQAHTETAAPSQTPPNNQPPPAQTPAAPGTEPVPAASPAQPAAGTQPLNPAAPSAQPAAGFEPPSSAAPPDQAASDVGLAEGAQAGLESRPPGAQAASGTEPAKRAQAALESHPPHARVASDAGSAEGAEAGLESRPPHGQVASGAGSAEGAQAGLESRPPRAQVASGTEPAKRVQAALESRRQQVQATVENRPAPEDEPTPANPREPQKNQPPPAETPAAAPHRTPPEQPPPSPGGVPVPVYRGTVAGEGVEGELWTGQGPVDNSGQTRLCPVGEVRPPGMHNISNALAAAALARAIGVSAEAVREGLRNYQPQPHRVQLVGEIDGVQYVNDSKATNNHAAAGSLSAYDSIVWIAGGLLHGAEVDDLVSGVARRLRGVVLLGADQEVFVQALRRHAPEVPVKRLDSRDDSGMTAAVRAARDLARPGDVVLLAPAAKSHDMFTSYVHRGEAFTKAVQASA